MRLVSVLLVVSGVVAVPQGIIVHPQNGLTFNALAGRAVSPDYSCGTTGDGGSTNGYTCPSDLECCSIHGWCGSTSDYCSINNGCQTAYGTCNDTATAPTIPTASGTTAELGGQCGPGFGSCAATECCSPSGWCGSTPGMIFAA